MHRQLQQSSLSSPPELISKKQLEESDSFSRRFCLIRQTHGQGTLSCISMCLSPALQSEGQKRLHYDTERLNSLQAKDDRLARLYYTALLCMTGI